MEFEMPKSFEETRPPVEVTEGEYVFALVKPAYTQINNAGSGFNIILELAITGENDERDGLVFNYYLPMPNDGDVEKRTRRGQSMVDWKMDRIGKTIEVLGGKIKGKKFIIPDQALCKAKIEIGTSNETGEPFPQISGDLKKKIRKGSR